MKPCRTKKTVRSGEENPVRQEEEIRSRKGAQAEQKKETLCKLKRNTGNPVRRGDLFKSVQRKTCAGGKPFEKNETLQVLECSDILCKFFKYQNLRNLKTIFTISHFVMLKESNKPFIMTLPFLGEGILYLFFFKPRELEI